jgi:hypothetical protein
MRVRRKANATGRSLAARDRMQSTGVWADQRWASFGVELLESYAWRAASGLARKVVDRIVVEHLHHGSLENGNLPVTYDDFVAYGLRRHSVRLALEEAIALGLIDLVPGVRAWGDFKGTPARYRLTWFGTKEGTAPSNRWKRFCSMKEARAAVKGSRDAVISSRSRLKGSINIIPLSERTLSAPRAEIYLSSVESGTVSSAEICTG